ncbi:GntR family transcriptional regulator [Acetonema longum]|uniref:GntR family transcriptional regulator n=1 Tax=Acetonema longum DSM 6540 TaxID=1009370 RepID=F7NKS2_9FIRM|nr:GntR family transcriptional regulator [Acetonema longum]EGO63376.1 GntR family transcriptional regulator [Acetonema longum DSM 6540]
MKNYNLKSHLADSYRTLPSLITGVLREKILSGELGGGTPLKQEELASQFNVSMSALREALKSLEAEGLVRFYPNRGAIVSELSAAEAKEIFEIRLFLELGALELAIPNLKQTELDAADGFLQEADAQLQNDRCSELNWRFHEVLYRPGGNDKLLSLIQTMHNNVERYMRLYLSTLHYHAKSQAEHRSLLEACARSDIKGAQEVLRRHMTDACASLSGYLRQANKGEV